MASLRSGPPSCLLPRSLRPLLPALFRVSLAPARSIRASEIPKVLEFWVEWEAARGHPVLLEFHLTARREREAQRLAPQRESLPAAPEPSLVVSRRESKFSDLPASA